MKKPKRLNLHLPKAWAQLTTQEMEQFAEVLQRHAATSQLNMQAVKTELLFEWNGIKILDITNPEVLPQDQRLLVTHPAVTYPFEMALWEIKSFIDNNLNWVDEPSNISRFPYPTWRCGFKTFAGPAVMMQNFSWRQYDLACAYMGIYIKCSNELAQLMQSPRSSKADIQKRIKWMEQSKASFLASIFNGKIKYLDLETGLKRKAYEFVSYQSTENIKYFRHFSDTKFQCVLWWWAGMMNYLQKQYPKCFKAPTRKKGRGAAPQDPLQQQAQLTATLEKYTGQNDLELYRKNYTYVLKHLNNMIEQNDEMEKMNKK